MLHRNLTSFR